MTRFGLLFAAFAIGLASLDAAGSPIQLEVKGTTVLPPGEIRLANVAAVTEGEASVASQVGSVSLGATPWPGNARVVTHDQVIMHLVRAGVDVSQIRWRGAESCAVTVQTVKVTGEQIVQTAREYLAGLPMFKRDDVKMDVDQTPRDQFLAGGETGARLAASVTSVDRPWGKVRVYVRISMGDKVVATVPVMFQVTCRQTVLFAVHALNKGDLVDVANVEAREIIVGAGTESDQYLVNSADVIGKKATRAVAAGSPLTTALVAEPHAIRRGDSVSILLRSAHMEVLTKGVAQSDGFVGDVVAIKIMLSGKDVPCKVLANGSVELPL